LTEGDVSTVHEGQEEQQIGFMLRTDGGSLSRRDLQGFPVTETGTAPGALHPDFSVRYGKGEASGCGPVEEGSFRRQPDQPGLDAVPVKQAAVRPPAEHPIHGGVGT